MNLPSFFSPATRQMLPRMRVAGPMPWVIAIMMFLTVLTAAAGLGLNSAGQHMRRGLSDRITIQVIEADPRERDRQISALLGELHRLEGVRQVRRIDQKELSDLLEPWLGDALVGEDIALPGMIDVDLGPDARTRIPVIADMVATVAPAARIDDHGRWMEPLDRLVGMLRGLSIALVLLMATAAAFTVVLAARAALDLHRDTIDVMHLLGATDLQIARLFQSQIARDALMGGMAGFLAAAVVLVIIAQRISGLGSELVGAIGFGPLAWLLLLLLPLGGVLLSMGTARFTILLALRRML